MGVASGGGKKGRKEREGPDKWAQPPRGVNVSETSHLKSPYGQKLTI
jgi:hypothetical protein